MSNLPVDEVIDKAVDLCRRLPGKGDFSPYTENLNSLKERLSKGEIHIAVLGQFNRGKSTFINALLGNEVLPISVLPITSTPTVIKYGENNRCRIGFSDRKQTVEAEGIEQTREVLVEYATEKNNPENRKRVSSVVVEHRSSLLGHGTRIIDTPGFGSTFIHNTDTTLSYLDHCDAVLFLLSADLPVTQVELQFLTKVREKVENIFFVFNKIDLLSPDERVETEEFIKSEIETKLRIDTKLYPVSAKVNSEGIERIREIIEEFIDREKYFTLSGSIVEKYLESIVNILLILKKKRETLMSTLWEKKRRYRRLVKIKESSEYVLNKELAFLKVEKDALKKHASEFIESSWRDVVSSSESRLEGLIESLLDSKNFHEVILQGIEDTVERDLASLSHRVSSEISSPLRKAFLSNCRRLSEAASKLCREIEVDSDIQDFEEIVDEYAVFEDLDVKVSEYSPEIDGPPDKKGVFESRAGFKKRISAFYSDYLNRYTSELKGRLIHEAQERIHRKGERFKTGFSSEYKLLLNELNKRIHTLENEIQGLTEKNKKGLKVYNTLCSEFISAGKMIKPGG